MMRLMEKVHNHPRSDEPAGKLRDADVEDAVEVERRTPHTDGRPRSPLHNDSSAAQALSPLFNAAVARDFRTRWDAAQIGFVDDPRQAVQQADELVAQVMNSLTQGFADERRRLEAEMNDTASTENLRVTLQHYRSFFQRLLSL
jgi:hypothetical protein